MQVYAEHLHHKSEKRTFLHYIKTHQTGCGPKWAMTQLAGHIYVWNKLFEAIFNDDLVNVSYEVDLEVKGVVTVQKPPR